MHEKKSACDLFLHFYTSFLLWSRGSRRVFLFSFILWSLCPALALPSLASPCCRAESLTINLPSLRKECESDLNFKLWSGYTKTQQRCGLVNKLDLFSLMQSLYIHNAYIVRGSFFFLCMCMCVCMSVYCVLSLSLTYDKI